MGLGFVGLEFRCELLSSGGYGYDRNFQVVRFRGV